METGAKLCACGCGTPVVKPWHQWIRGHSKIKPELHGEHLCACGCGQPTANAHRKWIKGHHMRVPQPQTERRVERQLCACGCGELAPIYRTYLRGHYNRAKAANPQGKQAMRQAFFEHTGMWAPTKAEGVVMTGLWMRRIRFLFQIPVDGVCRPDFIFPDAKIALQIDDPYHTRTVSKERDVEDDAALAASGWLVVRWRNDDVESSLDALLEAFVPVYESRL